MVILKKINIIFQIIFIFFYFSCKNNKNSGFQNINIRDDLGNEFNLNKKPQRIISLAPNITESIYSIGADSLLVGITDYCDFPPETKYKKRIGGMINPNLEEIISLNPDMILLTVEGNSKATYQSLKNLGYSVYAFNPRNFDGICKMLEDIGKITEKREKSEELVEDLKKSRDFILSLNNTNSLKSCFIIISVIPLITTNKTTFINGVIELCNLKNIYSEEQNSYPEISYEDLSSNIPDYMVLPVDFKDTTQIRKSIQVLKEKLKLSENFIKNNILLVDENILMRPGPRVLDGTKQILKLINQK